MKKRIKAGREELALELWLRERPFISLELDPDDRKRGQPTTTTNVLSNTTTVISDSLIELSGVLRIFHSLQVCSDLLCFVEMN